MKKLTLLIFYLSFEFSCAYKVIIIGAGASGLAAFERLIKNKIDDILILEAERKIGGRVHTATFGDSFVELGAEWVHGEVDNKVFEMVNKYNVLETSPYSLQFYSSSLPEIAKPFSDELNNIKTSLYNEEGKNISIKITSVIEDFKKGYIENITKRYKDQPEKLYIAMQSLKYFEMDITNKIAPLSLEDVPVNHNYLTPKGDLSLRWKNGGYKTLFSIMMDKLDKGRPPLPLSSKLIVKSEVERIIWKGNWVKRRGVTVYTSGGKSYNADLVIFTPSLGVLKHKHSTMFQPQLPTSKLEAIFTAGFGCVGKYFLRFKKRWWPEIDFEGFGLVWTEDIKPLLTDFPKGPSIGGESWLLHITGFYDVPNNPKVLAVKMTGALMKEVELIPDEIILDGFKFVMEKIFNRNYMPPEPVEILRSTWGSNPHFYGSYSYETISSLKLLENGMETLAEPLLNELMWPTVLFAGEATHRHYYSTVHGAVESGYREAERAIQILSKLKP